MLIFTPHALYRMSQRNFSEEDVIFIIKYGQLLRRAGAKFFLMRQKDFPKHLRREQKYARLDGATVVVCKCSEITVVKTVYFASDFQKIKRKATHTSRPNIDNSCQHCQGLHAS